VTVQGTRCILVLAVVSFAERRRPQRWVFWMA
jgi:hypothetical protein